jgi:hypothetical protein
MKIVVVLLALLGLGAALAALQLPELKRYMKMRSM